MRKIKYLFLLVMPFLFIGCPSPFLEMNVDCTIDKNSYKENEPIVLTCSGSFADEDDMGSFSVDIDAYKIVNGKTDFKCMGKINFIESNFKLDEGVEKNTLCISIIDDSKMSPFTGKIKFSIEDEPGEYEVFCWCKGGSENHVYGNSKIFNFPIKITAAE